MNFARYRFEEIRAGSYDQELLALWNVSQDRKIGSGLSLQDRSPRPLALYRGWGNEEPRVFVAWNGEDLVASSVIVPHFPYVENGSTYQFNYDTDLFVHPAHRSSTVLIRLLDFRHKVLASTTDIPKTMYFAISHREGLGDAVIPRFMKRSASWGKNLFDSTLSEFVCGGGPESDSELAVEIGVSPIEFSVPSGTSPFVFPFGQWRDEHLTAVKSGTRLAEHFHFDKTGYSGMLCDFHPVRKIRWNHRAERLLTGIRNGDEIGYLIASFFEGSQTSGELEPVLEELIQYASKRNYNFLAVRDVPGPILDSLKKSGYRSTTHSRSVFAWGFTGSENFAGSAIERLAGEVKGERRVRLESLFL